MNPIKLKTPSVERGVRQLEGPRRKSQPKWDATISGHDQDILRIEDTLPEDDPLRKPS
jgi:hypothetical protein